jgi:hypothetical protein
VDAPQPAADWRNAAHYAALQSCGRHAFVWEWLRRSPSYRAAIPVAGDNGTRCQLAARFGLHLFEDADRIAPSARPIWRADAGPYVLTVEANCGHGDDLLDVMSFGPLATCHAGSEGREHWLLSDGWRQIRLDVVRGTLRSGPARLEYHIVGLANAVPQVAALTRLIALARTGRLVPQAVRKLSPVVITRVVGFRPHLCPSKIASPNLPKSVLAAASASLTSWTLICSSSV